MLKRTAMAAAVAVAVLTAGIAGPAAGMRLGQPAPGHDTHSAATLAEALAGLDAVAPATKLSAGLADLAAAGAPDRREPVVVQSLAPLDLGAYADFVHQFTWPAGEHVAVLEARVADLAAIAALPGVYAVDWASPDAPSVAPEPSTPWAAPQRLDAATLRRVREDAPTWWDTQARLAAQAAGDAADGGAEGDAAGAPPADGWWDVRAGHAAREAWDLGFRGEGVKVAVLDFATDFGHPDLHGTWAVLPPAHPYAGWPQAFDPWAGYQRTFDRTRAPAQQSTRTGATGFVELYQDSDVTTRDISGTLKTTACFQALVQVQVSPTAIATQLAPESCDFVVPETSKSAKVRYGHHPDTFLRPLGARAGTVGELAGVIIVDEHAAGDYDTVYVDLDNDRDFTDEKPMTRQSPLGWRDMNDDAIADLSAGLLYFVSDGELPLPGAWVWGLESDIPAAGRMIAINFANGDHGTLCSSNVVAQGRLGVPKDREIRFRDLPGDGQPQGVNFGLAPAGQLVSIGSVYAGGRAMFAPAWRYSVFGHDIQRADDDIQVTSNSYGFSDQDDDGWDADSRLLDFYVQKYSRTTSFLIATGNGGPGYGTLAAPSPSVGVDVAASTQFGSTGQDSITDTTQITFGDIIPFSNRGPSSNGVNGPEVAGDGAYAAGAVPINFVYPDGGVFANATWGGTSRATPVAAGAMTLVYQAFKARHDRWPTWEEAKAVLMAGARFNGYDTFTMGGGVVDAADAVRIGSGKHGVYAMPPDWTAGDFRGGKHGAFARLMAPGESDSTKLTLRNPSDAPVEVTLSAKTLRRIGHTDGAFTVDRTAESPAGPVPDFLVPIDKAKIPAGTELMVARGAFPYTEFDLGADLIGDNYFNFGVIQHTDVDGDGLLWNDKNANGAVNYRTTPAMHLTLAWDDQTRDHGATEGGATVPVPPEGISGEIAWYGLGCNNPDGTPPTPMQEVNEKIALIERGTCTFFQKLTNAKNAGAVAAVVFTDDRAVVTMGSTEGNIPLPGAMIERAEGLELKGVLEQGKTVNAAILHSHVTLRGLGGAAPVKYADSEIDRYEYMTISADSGLRNHFAVSVHHPLERWSNGLYLSMAHLARAPGVTETHITTRLDYYGYQDWPALALSQNRVTVPAKGEATVDVTLSVPADAAYGGWQGAIFADYARGAGDLPVAAPGGYELPQQRVVVPVNTTVAAVYDWQGSLTFGGAKGDDRDAPYNNGAMWGTFKWNWRPESGDWRYFFWDATSAPSAGTYWVLRTRWDDPNARQADIDTRLYGPLVDRYSNPADPANQPGAPGGEDRSDPGWFGPYTLGLVTRSPYLVAGSVWPFNTSSGENEDWLVSPAREGLHEAMLHNVLFSGSQLEMPFETTVSSVRVATRTAAGTGGVHVTLVGDRCTSLDITSQMALPDARVRAYGMSLPRMITGAKAKVAASPAATETFRTNIDLTSEAGFFQVTLTGQPNTDPDLYVLRDANGDGTFDFASEIVGQGTGPTENEVVTLSGFTAPGKYQVWVHNSREVVPGLSEATFDLKIDIVSGDSLELRNAPDAIVPGQPATVDVCARTADLQGATGPARGIIVVGWKGAVNAIQVPVTWWPRLPISVFLPEALQGFDLMAPLP